jgi:transposase
MPAPLLPDDLWQRIESLLPRQRRRHVLFAGRRPSDPRSVMAGIIFALKTGVPWEYLPASSVGNGLYGARF